MKPLRLGIDLDGVIADFNSGWMDRYNRQFDTSLATESVQSYDGLLDLTHFASIAEFWRWASDLGDGSIFRHLPAYDGAVEAVTRLAHQGHRIVILTTKPPWGVSDTYAWLAEKQIPTTEVHILTDKWVVDCDIYLDDAPHVLEPLVNHRPDATVCRYVRPWNKPVPGAVDVTGWNGFHELVASRGDR